MLYRLSYRLACRSWSRLTAWSLGLRSVGHWGRRLMALMLVGILVVSTASCSLAQFETEGAAVPRIVYSVLSDPKTFNYALSQESPNVFSWIYDGLITQNGLTAEVEPALAESWAFSEDGLSVVFTLRDQLKWSDGEPLTVEDVLFTYNDVILNEAIPTDDRDALRVGEDGLFPEITKLDDRRIQFRVPEPFAPFLRSMGGIPILPKHVLAKTIEEKDSEGNPIFLSTWGTDTDPTQIICNGPYRLKQYLPSERVIFERNPYYWRQDDQGNAQPYIEQMVWQLIESTDAELVQFRSGGLDVTSVRPDNYSLLKREEKRGNFTIYVGDPVPSTSFVWFNLNRASRKGKPLVDPIKSKWFNNVNFRRAVAYAIDRQTMLNNIYQGIGEFQNSPLSYQSPYFASVDDGLPAYDYDIEKAKQLLLSEQFSYDAQDKLVDAEGNEVRFTLITNSGNKIRESMGAQIKQDLAAIGITADFQPISFGSLVDKLSDSLEWDCALLGLTGGIEPNNGSNVWRTNGGLHMFNQQALPGQEPIDGWQAADWEEQLSNLYIKAAQELDETKRKQLYFESQRLSQEYLPFIYLINSYGMSAVRNHIKGVRYSALGGALWNIYELQLTEG